MHFFANGTDYNFLNYGFTVALFQIFYFRYR